MCEGILYDHECDGDVSMEKCTISIRRDWDVGGRKILIKCVKLSGVVVPYEQID